MSTHLRGRVYVIGRLGKGRLWRGNPIVWGVEVINEVSGEVIYRDNLCNLTRAHDHATRSAELARVIYVTGIRHKDTLPKRRKS
jgi:hypothetical protein